ncbi:MAG: transglutaminase domain-containing protein [Candidatus Woesearchaeota archaeon]
MKHILVFILLLLVMPISLANLYGSQEAETIFTSERLVLRHTIRGGVDVFFPSARSELLELTADVNMMVRDSYRQKLLDASYNPRPFIEDSILFTWQRFSDASARFEIVYDVETTNSFREITEKVVYPFDVPSDLRIYVEPTEKIDITTDIINQASMLASGKDDLFDIAQTIAFWIYTNIDYDLSTINEEAQHPASWVLENRRGVCVESSLLFIAMMRSLNIPTRYVSGMSFTNSQLFDDPWNAHAWAEVYFPGYGWVPFDLTYGQFGFIDAGHITFRETADVHTTSARYAWRAYNVESISVIPQPNEFKTEIISSSGTITDGFTLTVDTWYQGVSPSSYNILRIKAVNNKDHYVSSVLSIFKPLEVSGESRIPIFLRPHEERYFYVILSVDSLSPNFIYTMPLSIYTTHGSVYTTAFDVSRNSPSVSLSDVNQYLSDRSPGTVGSVRLHCDTNVIARIGQQITLNCILSNEGPTHIEAELCIRDDCEEKVLPIGRSDRFSIDVVGDTLGNFELPVSVAYEDETLAGTVSYRIVPEPSLAVTLDVPSSVSFGEEFTITGYVRQENPTVPEDVRVSLEIQDRPYEWKLADFSGNTDITIPFFARNLQEGDNELVLTVYWDSGVVSTTEVIILEPLTFWQKIMSWWYRTF